MFRSINNQIRIHQRMARFVYSRFSPMMPFHDITVNAGSRTDGFMNSLLGVQNFEGRLALRSDFPGVLQTITSRIDILRQRAKPRDIEFPENTKSVSKILHDEPMIFGIVDRALSAHSPEQSGHDKSHIRTVVNRAVRFAEEFNKIQTSSRKKVDLKTVIIGAAVHDLGQTIEGIGRDLHSTEEAGNAILGILRQWNSELKDDHPQEEYISDDAFMMARLCVVQHSLGKGDEADKARVAAIEKPIVRLVTLADKSCGGGMLGVARCVLFSVRKKAAIFEEHEKNGDKYPSSEKYIRTVLLQYIEYVKGWPEYSAVSHIIERQSKGMQQFIDQLREESLIIDKIRNSLNQQDAAILEKVINNVTGMLAKKVGINELIHPQRVMIVSLQIAAKYAKYFWHGLSKHDLLILALAALLHNFWKFESEGRQGYSKAFTKMFHMLKEAGIAPDDISAIFRIIDYKHVNQSVPQESILKGIRIADSLPLSEIDFEKNKKMRLMADILADAETIAKNFGAHGVVYNIHQSAKDKIDNDTILYGFLDKMQEFARHLQNIKLEASKKVALPLADFTANFLGSAIEEQTHEFDPVKSIEAALRFTTYSHKREGC